MEDFSSLSDVALQNRINESATAVASGLTFEVIRDVANGIDSPALMSMAISSQKTLWKLWELLDEQQNRKPLPFTTLEPPPPLPQDFNVLPADNFGEAVRALSAAQEALQQAITTLQRTKNVQRTKGE